MVDLAIGGSRTLPSTCRPWPRDRLRPTADGLQRVQQEDSDPLRHIANGPHGVIDLYVAGGVPAVMSGWQTNSIWRPSLSPATPSAMS